MEPPAGAALTDGAWHDVPAVPPMARLLLANSQSGGDYRLCWEGACGPLASLLPASSAEPIELMLRKNSLSPPPGCSTEQGSRCP